MLKVKLINEQATLNNFHYVEVKEYIAEQKLVLKIQVQDSETKQRLIPDQAANCTATFQKRDGTELQIEGEMLFGDDDRSMWQFELTPADTLEIVGSNVLVELDFNASATAAPDLSDSTDLRVGMAYNVLAKITFDGEC